MARDFILEIGMEELPARFIAPSVEQMRQLAGKALRDSRIAYKEIKTYGTPRRIAILISDLAEDQEALIQEAKGPAVKVAFNAAGEPTRAAQGFAKSQGVQVEDLVRKSVGPVEYVFALKKEEGGKTFAVLPAIALALIEGLHFPKPMRWGDLEVRFARPIRWLLCLYGKDVVKFEFAGLRSDRYTMGHRFLSYGKVEITDAGSYCRVLEEAFVMADIDQRKSKIRSQIEQAAVEKGGRPETNEELLDEVTNLVEYPTALCGSFDGRYLEMPEEVLITPMREHQRYFPVRGSDDRLLPLFVAVSNGGAGNVDIVRAGNEKVLRARLSDAAFFWQEDLKAPLEDKVDRLKKVIFQESLGTIYEKVQRITNLADYIGGRLGAPPEERSNLLRAARLAKADLLTNMVYEFPELQGIMGREYARRFNEPEGVALAIYEHYLPRFAGDDLPDTLPGKILSIADKLDTLVGCFGVGIQPTGSQDPYALRRQALGICHIILDAGLTLSLAEMIEQAYNNYADRVKMKLGVDQVISELGEFFKQRLRVLFIERGLSYDTVDAVLAPGYDAAYDTWLRGKALEQFRSEPAFEALLTAFTRAYNLSKKTESDQVAPALFETEVERELYAAFHQVSKAAGDSCQAREYNTAFSLIAELQKPVDRFFEDVMVMVEDPRIRDNRLALLKNIADFIGRVADLSKLVVQNK
ncbi:glycyl-tRNA synthetase beta chain [Desulfotomaculum arcticum]|uniref:Glycine--tRNA ligase beta subunit n=1 Tax=Desulfotruncus arcticus DSM 17038 TaxID=1121424 RepID=A0A1I2XG20_9FIRM|nr:glycine--tRNA ligase subunit beta [Desulfotruncus arcticus]SFH12362.1 glycyl-tRNA synthetase beta chain [Desulfotomaculum arcticum] [Desulfotruncus arcticus DSM 17038]